MQTIQKLHNDFIRMQQQYRQLVTEYQKITSVYARLDYLYPLLKEDMRDSFSEEFKQEVIAEVEELVKSFKLEVKDEEPNIETNEQ